MPFLAVLLALIAVLCAVGGARAVRRRRADEIRSVHHYHERLDVLHVEPQDRGGSVRLVEGEPHDHGGAQPPRPRLDPASARVDAAAPGDVPRDPEAERRHGRDWALGRSQPRARVDTATILVVTAVIAGLLVLGIVGYLIQHGRGTSTTTTTVTTTTGPAAISPGTTSTTVVPAS